MNYQIAQNPDLSDVLEMERPLSSVNPIETFENQSKPAIETDGSYSKLSGLLFPSSYAKVAESLTKLGVKVNENSLKGRWLKNYIEPALEGVDCPSWKKDGITEFGFNAIAEILQRCVLAGESNIAPQTLRDELIERYGVNPVEDSLKAAKELLERSKQQKNQAVADQESSNSALVIAQSKAELLLESLKLRKEAKSIKPSESKRVLSVEEMVNIFAEEMDREDAIEAFRNQVREGRVTIEDIL